jgi:hypothetical protein
MPAPTPVKIHENKVTLRGSVLQKNCRNFSVKYSSHSGGDSRVLYRGSINDPKKSLKINTNFLYHGTIAISCQSKRQDIGPQLWFLIPVKADRSFAPPGSLTVRSGDLNSKLSDWVNHIRQDNLLAPIKPSRLNLQPSQNHVLHFKKAYQAIKQELSSRNLKLIGENRVVADTISDIKWMLWNSPDHRDLLLSSKGDTIIVNTEKVNHQISALFLLAHTK